MQELKSILAFFTQSLKKPSSYLTAERSAWLEAIEPIIAALIYAMVISVVTRWWTVYEFGSDEGVNLMKAALVSEGFGLYDEIWSDQPPIFTLILAPVYMLFPSSVGAARAVVLAFAGLMIFSLFRIAKRADGRAAGWIAVVAVAGERAFGSTSASVMIGMPAIAIALAGFDQSLAGAKSGSRLRFVAAGILFGVALQTKMFVAAMIPALCMTPLVDRWGLQDLRRRAGSDLFVLAMSAIASFVIIAVTFGMSLDQVFSPHLAAVDAPPFRYIGGLGMVLESFRPLILPMISVLGIVTVLLHGRLVHAIPVVWLLVAGMALSLHRPFWVHQAVLLQVPVAWLCGQAVALIDPSSIRRQLTVVLTVAMVLITATSLRSFARELADARGGRALDSPLLTRNQRVDEWVVTDRLMDAYRANSLVPPEVAVNTMKRRVTKNLTEDQLTEVIAKYLPAEVLLRRFRPTAAFVRSLDRSHEPVLTGRGFHHAMRRKPLARPAAELDKQGLVTALLAATADLASREPSGGYPGHVDFRSGARYGRTAADEPLLDDEISVRPPGSTQEVGQCMRRAYQVTGEVLFDERATAAGLALACSQRFGGGWNEVALLRGSCGWNEIHHGVDRKEHPMTIDDGTTPSALEFLLDLQTDFQNRGWGSPPWLRMAVGVGLRALLIAQGDSGGWPQHFPPPSNKYPAYFTFNDGAISSVIEVLLKSYDELGKKKYLDAALRGGAFILATQGPDTQAGWAQQYDTKLLPASARAFEPAGYSSRETGEVMNALLYLYMRTGDPRFSAAVTRARSWLESSTIRPGVWARLYEVGTNRPIYGDRDGQIHYDLSEVSRERRLGYEWEGRFESVVRALERDDARVSGGINGLRDFDETARQLRELAAEEWKKTAQLVDRIAVGGRWSEGDVVSTATFVVNCSLLTRAIAKAR